MNNEETKSKGKNLLQRLHAIMAEAGRVEKEDKKVNNQYKFVSHDAVTNMIRPLLIEHGVLSIPRVVGHRQDGNTTEADMEVTFYNIDKPDESITVPGFGYGVDTQDKGPGKAMSYAVKMLFLKTFCLETGEKDNEVDNVNSNSSSFYKNKYPPNVKTVPDSIYDLSLDQAKKLTKEMPPAVKAALKELGLSRGYYHAGDFVTLYVNDEGAMLRALDSFDGINKAVPKFMGESGWSLIKSVEEINRHIKDDTLKVFEEECIKGTAVPF